MYQLKYLELAKEDMNNIIRYINENLHNRTAAENMAIDFINNATKILAFPYANMKFIPFSPLKFEYRYRRIKNYLMFYRIDKENKIITIMRVLYQKSNLEKFLE